MHAPNTSPSHCSSIANITPVPVTGKGSFTLVSRVVLYFFNQLRYFLIE
jgi:hypothetical protein